MIECVLKLCIAKIRVTACLFIPLYVLYIKLKNTFFVFLCYDVRCNYIPKNTVTGCLVFLINEWCFE